ncbi:MAG TPA: SDR family oxidoreductase [Stellaceae bacterium]|nr:SDR family oxidoreductase [Stellaceae bacterium]
MAQVSGDDRRSDHAPSATAARAMGGRILIAGALGLVGRAVLERCESVGGWDIVALSRRAPVFPTKAHFIGVDLASAEDCRAKLGTLMGITHIVYCALYEKPDLGAGWLADDQIATNRAMLANFFDAVAPGNPGLRHIALLQGTKAYGAHLGQIPVPAKESAPRHPHPNFYWAQEDFIRARQEGAGWHFTIFRPQAVIGFALGSAMNLLSAFGVYAAVMRELGQPLIYPGQGQRITEATDARLLAQAILWAGEAERARNETFNITNGDAFLYQNLWPMLAREFAMELGPAQPMPLAVVMRDKGPVWDVIARKHQLQPHAMDTLVGASWQFADFALSRTHSTSSLVSTIKLRQAGFGECIDTEAMFRWWIGELRRRRVLPA